MLRKIELIKRAEVMEAGGAAISPEQQSCGKTFETPVKTAAHSCLCSTCFEGMAKACRKRTTNEGGIRNEIL